MTYSLSYKSCFCTSERQYTHPQYVILIHLPGYDAQNHIDKEEYNHSQRYSQIVFNILEFGEDRLEVNFVWGNEPILGECCCMIAETFCFSVCCRKRHLQEVQCQIVN